LSDKPDERKAPHVATFLKLSATWERALLWTIALLFALLILFQALLTIPGVRERISDVDRLEGHATRFAPFR